MPSYWEQYKKKKTDYQKQAARYTPRIVSRPPTPTIGEAEAMAQARRRRARQADSLLGGYRVRGHYVPGEPPWTGAEAPAAEGYRVRGRYVPGEPPWTGVRTTTPTKTDWGQAALDWRQRSLQHAQQTTASLAAPKPLSKLAQAILSRAQILMGYDPYLYDDGAGGAGGDGGYGGGYYGGSYRGGNVYYGGGAAPSPTYYGGGVGTGRISTQPQRTAGRYGLGMVNWRI